MAYKKNIGDTRESPAVSDRAAPARARRDAELSTIRSVHGLPETRSWPGPPDALAAADGGACAQDAVVVVTDHSEVDYGWSSSHAPLIVDARGVYPRGEANVVKA